MPSEKNIWFYVTTPLDSDMRKFDLNRIEGEEQISGLFHYKLTLNTNDDKTVDFKKLMGKKITANFVYMDSSHTRYINGIVTRFIQAEFDGEIVTYHAEIRPWLWQLTLASNNKIFQNKKVTEIITSVFSDRGFQDFKDNTKGSYQPREYCVQYGETDFNFVSRLMEEEGIFYFFEHTKEKHTLIMADESGAFQDCPGLKAVRLRYFNPEKDDLAESCTLEEELVSNKYMAKDFNFETPDTDVFATADAKESGKLSVYDYPGGFLNTGEGEKVANKRIEAIEVPIKILKGETYCRGFIAGYQFKFIEHYRSDVNDTYIIRRLSVDSADAQYRNTFEAFPASAPFRPPMTSPKPRIFGTQTAMVVGKAGEEIWTDKYGRVMVQFHWDRDGKKDEKSSCWIRVAQMWGGKNWGTLFIPRIGTEAIVTFLEGDPDQPLIIGTVYNASYILPYPMPANKNLSTIKTVSAKKGETGEKKGNEIRFDDTKDAEEFFIHAQKDMNIFVERHRTTEINKDGNDSLTLLKGNRTILLSEGNEERTLTRGNRMITLAEGNQTLKLDKGDEVIQIKGKRTLTIDDKEDHTSKADFSHTVKGNFVLKVDGDLTIDVKGKITIKSGMDMLHNAGMNLTSKAGMNLKNEAGVNLDNKAGAAMTNKASAAQEVNGGGMLTLKGGTVKIN